MSEIWKLTKNDYLKGLVVAVLSGVLTLILDLLKANAPIDWNQVLTVGLIAGIGYLIKNLGTSADGKLLGKY